MNGEKDQQLSTRANLRSRFITITVEQSASGRARIVLEGPYMDIAGFEPGEHIDAIIQPDLISLLRVD